MNDLFFRGEAVNLSCLTHRTARTIPLQILAAGHEPFGDAPERSLFPYFS